MPATRTPGQARDRGYRRNEEGDRDQAIELEDGALAITQEPGMRPLTEGILARREILKAEGAGSRWARARDPGAAFRDGSFQL